MLRLIIGKAGTGKTAAIINEIKQAVENRQGGQMLIVPEQYSHEAERELCAACGDSLSLYAEVFNFTSLARRIMSQQGGVAEAYLDKGGRLLCMALAMGNAASRLRVYANSAHKAETHAMMLSAIDEMKAAGLSPAALEEAAGLCGRGLGDKMHDLALIAEAYDAVVSNGHADPADRLTVLAGQIPSCEFVPGTKVYIDGFIDFTQQEHEIIKALLKRDIELCVCMTLDELYGQNEIFALSRRSCHRLLRDAKEQGIDSRIETAEAVSQGDALAFFADNMFSYSAVSFDGAAVPVSLHCAESLTAECEYAAAQAIRLVSAGSCRWRDIAIAVRGFDDYRAPLESVFRHYDVPLFVARKSSMMSKPIPSLIAGAYEIIDDGWDVDTVIAYMRTGFTGLGTAECDELAAYIFKWQLRGAAWERDGDWMQHPDGYGNDYDEQAQERLARINALRRRLAVPLLDFARRGSLAQTASEQAASLALLLEQLELPAQLAARAEALEHSGKGELAQEYAQLWEICISALEQSASILGGTAMDMQSFGKLFFQMLSKYDVGTIPVSLDRVSAGDFDRMRRRSIKHLIVLGCSDNRLPRAGEDKGLFSDEERRLLLDYKIELGGDEGELWREFSLIYNCLSLPSESLSLVYPGTGADGESLRPAFVFNRAQALFDLKLQPASLDESRLLAKSPALSLAAHGLKGGSVASVTAAEYFRRREPARFKLIENAANIDRGRLSNAAVTALYGQKPKLSASRVDKFASCKFAYFCQYGLRAKPYEPAGFSPPEIGSFMHFVLENVAGEVKLRGGFKAVSDEDLKQITDKYVNEYVKTELNDFQEKSRRFIYLFKRLGSDVYQVVKDMAEEMRRSSFEPLDFELDLSRAQDMRPLELDDGDAAVTLTGIVDRVDGWYHEGKLYLRVVDYKTGKKKFSLSDLWYGMGLQMLLYLFALEADGRGRYKHEIVPAGVMYVPARNTMLSLQENINDFEAEKKRSESVRRSGLVLAEEALLEAWENGEEKRYIPVKFKAGKPGADSIASLERMGMLSRHIKSRLSEMAELLHRGGIAADPYYRSGQENACLNCEFTEACHFSDGENGESCRYMPKLRDAKVWEKLEGREENE